MKLLDFLLPALIFLFMGAAVFYLVKRKKKGCAGSCGHCPYHTADLTCEKGKKTKPAQKTAPEKKL